MTSEYPIWLIILSILLIFWEIVWKGMALWKSAQRNQLVWFVCILILNTVGILPIIYLLITKGKENASSKRG
jgi:hypothetical protein